MLFFLVITVIILHMKCQLVLDLVNRFNLYHNYSRNINIIKNILVYFDKTQRFKYFSCKNNHFLEDCVHITAWLFVLFL